MNSKAKFSNHLRKKKGVKDRHALYFFAFTLFNAVRISRKSESKGLDIKNKKEEKMAIKLCHFNHSIDSSRSNQELNVSSTAHNF